MLGSDTLASSYSYDNASELTDINYQDTTKSVTLANYTYSYNSGGELTGYQDNSGNSLTYGYDANGELTSATGTLNSSNHTFTYNYDLNGNRTSTSTDINGSLVSATYTTGTGNELLSDGTYKYTYDNDGNLVSQTNIATGYVTYYTWDYRNRLIEVKQEDNHGNVLNDEKFTYDVNNNRIAVTLNGTTQLYTVYDGANPYMDFNGSGTLTQRYLYNPNSLSQFYGQVNGSGSAQWFLTDNINSIRQIISASGTVLDAITYDPYGNILNQTNSTNAPRLMFAGGAVDSITGNVQFDARPYNTGDGRFLTQDWEGFAAGDSNLFRYVFNDPLEFIDPTGLGVPRGGKLWRAWISAPPPPRPGSGIDGLPDDGGPLTAGSGPSHWGGTVSQQFHGGLRPVIGLAYVGMYWTASGPFFVSPSKFNPGGFGFRGRPGRPGVCFPAGTPVHTADGLKAIEQIEEGDRVWAYDHKQLLWSQREVLKVFKPLHRGTMATIQVKGETIRATGGHPFWVVRGEGLAERPRPKAIAAYEAGGRQEGRWVLACHLIEGDEVLLRHGEVVPLETVQLDEVEEQVYNFHVAELQNYAVGSWGVLVHNTNEETVPGSSDPTKNGPSSPRYPTPPEPPPFPGATWNPWKGSWDPPPGSGTYGVRPPGWGP
jgi:RHS repeat-associated protein